jgi:hypothetical protein
MSTVTEPTTFWVVASTNYAIACLQNTFTITLHKTKICVLRYDLCQYLCRHRIHTKERNCHVLPCNVVTMLSIRAVVSTVEVAGFAM